MPTSPRRRLGSRPGSSMAVPAFLIFVCASPTACTRSPLERALRYSDKAYVALEAGKVAEALQHIERAVALLPDSALPFLARGTIYRWKAEHDTIAADRDRDIQAAFADFDAAIARGPRHMLVYRTRADLELFAGMYDRALADLDTAMAFGPRSSDMYFLRGDAHLQRSDFQRAWIDFDSAMSLDPHSSSAVLGRAFAYAHQGDLAGARRDFDAARALQLDVDDLLRSYTWGTLHWPNRAAAYRGRGIVNWLVGRSDEAIRDLDSALKLEPNLARARSWHSLLAAVRAR